MSFNYSILMIIGLMSVSICATINSTDSSLASDHVTVQLDAQQQAEQENLSTIQEEGSTVVALQDVQQKESSTETSNTQGHVEPSTQGHVEPSTQGHVEPSTQGHVEPSTQRHVEPSTQEHAQPTTKRARQQPIPARQHKTPKSADVESSATAMTTNFTAFATILFAIFLAQ